MTVLHIVIEIIFKVMGYSLFLYGLWLLVGENFYDYYIKTGIRNYKNKRKLKRFYEINSQKERKIKQSPFMENIELVLSALNKNSNVSASNFVMFTTILMIVSTIIIYFLVKDLVFSTVIGITIGISPYLLNIYRLEHLRAKTSLGFLNEFHIFLQNYQNSKSNIYYTLYNSMNEIQDKHLKRQLSKLISSFQKERNEDEFRKHVHVFVYSINSTFAKRFGALIIKAHLNNVNIAGALQDLNNDIAQRKKGMEEEKTNRLQTVMLGFSPIVSLPLVFFLAVQVTGVLNFWKFFLYPALLIVFILTVVLSIISVALAFLLRQPKADI